MVKLKENLSFISFASS